MKLYCTPKLPVYVCKVVLIYVDQDDVWGVGCTWKKIATLVMCRITHSITFLNAAQFHEALFIKNDQYLSPFRPAKAVS